MPKTRRIDDTPVPTRFDAEELEMLEAIRHALGCSTRSGAVRLCVRGTYLALKEADAIRP